MSRSLLALITILSLSCAVVPSTPAADLVDYVNVLRSRGCAGHAGAPNKLAQTRALDAVAKEWSKGGRLQQALEKTGYAALNSSSMRVSGAPNEQAIVNVLAEHYCATVTNRAFTVIGIERRGRDAWLVVATPLNLPAASSVRIYWAQTLATAR